MIMIVYGYTLSMKISTENTDKKEWVTTSFCENPRRSSLKESIPELNDLIVIWYVIFVLKFSTYTAFIGV